jgi:YD repeat-containing protein
MTECASGATKRQLEIHQDGTGCRLDYTKDGQVQSVATQKVGRSKCEEVAQKIRTTLEGSGFQCSEPQPSAAN